MKLIIISLICVLTSLTAFADWKDRFDRLVKQTTRPTIQQVLDAITKSETPPSYSDIKRHLGLSSSHVNSNHVHAIGRFIAEAEFVYPSGTWAFLGRDVVNLADATDAFYRSLGQMNRVVRLNASTASFANTGSTRLARFLETNRFQTFSGEVLPNSYVVIDTTSYSSSSQSRLLVKAAYKALLDQGVSPAEALYRVGVATTRTSGDYHVTSQSGARSFAKANLKAISSSGHMTSILSFPTADALAYNTFTSAEWHGSFGAMKRNSGDLVATPGQQGSTANRKKILLHLVKFIEISQSGRLLKVVESEAKRLGYAFKKERRSAGFTHGVPAELAKRVPQLHTDVAQTLRAEAEEVRRLSPGERPKSLDALLANLPAQAGDEGRISHNGQRVAQWYRTRQRLGSRDNDLRLKIPLMLIQFVGEVRASDEKDKLRSRDGRRLIKEVFETVVFRNEAEVDFFANEILRMAEANASTARVFFDKKFSETLRKESRAYSNFRRVVGKLSSDEFAQKVVGSSSYATFRCLKSIQ